ncbi:MAG: lipid-A-disaccharide synthase N-terminal domain-containing protein [Nitrospirales bacterium]
MPSNEVIWVTIGFLGQSLFFCRWVLQWFVSERNAESRIPIPFWYMSLGGSVIVLCYALYRKDPVFIAGQSVGAVVYLRNLVLIHRSQARASSG